MLESIKTLMEKVKTSVSVSIAPAAAYVQARTRESEKDLEKALVSGIKRRGGMAVKLTSQFHRGLPDRLVLLPYRTICFVELKSTGAKRTKLQEVAAEQLDTLGFRAFVVDSSETLWELFQKMDKRIARIDKAIGANEVQSA